MQIPDDTQDIASGAISIEARPLELRLLGPFELIHRPSGDVIAISSGRVRALVAYLAATPRCTEGRRTLAGLLWAGKDEELARQSLRQLLSQFRRGCDPRASGLIFGDEATLSLDCSHVVIDRSTFFEVPADADITSLMKAADAYRHEFATGIEIGETEFDNWLQAERFRCREMAIGIFDRLVRALIEAKRHEEALRYANRLIHVDPLREETHRLVIAEEAIVSGRASAMARFEQFRVLLKEELGVRPEAATLQLLDGLRQTRGPGPATGEPAAPSSVEVTQSEIALHHVAPERSRSWRAPAFAAVFLATICLALGSSLYGAKTVSLLRAPWEADDPTGEHITVGIARFSSPDRESDLYANEVRRVFAENAHLSVIALPDMATAEDLIQSAGPRHIDYVLRTDVAQSDDEAQVTASLYDVRTATRIYAERIMMSGDTTAFAHRYYDLLYPAILLDHAHTLSLEDPNSIPALFWEATIGKVSHGDRTIDPPELTKFEAIVAKAPHNLDALVGAAWELIERAARDQSTGLNRTDDIYRATLHLEQAKRLETPRTASALRSEIAYLEGLLAKVQMRYADARRHFREALDAAPGNAQAAAQAAHVDMFLGHFEEAYAEMEGISNFDYTESSFLAAEAALMANHPERALYYYDRAVSTTPDIPRNYAWRAIALWRLNRKDEAHQDAKKSQDMKPAYRSYWIESRANLADKRYRDARAPCVADLEAALRYPQ